MKKFIQKIFIFATFCAVFTVAVSVIIDPYNVFHVSNIRDNGIEQNSNYIKMSYILDNPEKYDAFLFGSSRVGAIHTENIPDVNCYNMTYSEGVPKEHLDNLKTLIANGIIPKKVYLGVDSLSYTLNPDNHITQHPRMSYEYAKAHPIEFYSMYLTPNVAFQSLETTIAYTPSEEYAHRFYNYGWWCDYGRESLIGKDNAPTILGTYNLMDETLAHITEFVKLCTDNDITLTVFTNPMHYIAHYDSWSTYEEFLIRLAEVTDYYNFSGLNHITLNHSNYVDTSHYNAETGDLMIKFFSDNIDEDLYSQGFGMYVTKDNVTQLIELLNSQFPSK